MCVTPSHLGKKNSFGGVCVSLTSIFEAENGITDYKDLRIS